MAQEATLSQTATIQSLSFYVNALGGNLRLGLYADNAGSPGALLASTNEFTPTSTGWNTQNVVSPVSLPAGTYWLAYLPQSIYLGFKNGPGTAKWISFNYGPLPATFPSGGNGGSYQWSFYATLNTSSTPTPTPSATPTRTPTPIPTATATPKPSVTPTPSATPTRTPTPIPTATATPRPTATATPGPTGTPASLTLQDYNGSTVPMNWGNETYPSAYTGSGTATASLNSSDAITGKSVQLNLTSGALQAQWNPYDDNWRHFARDFSSNPSGWQYNTYNRMSFWVKRPTSASPQGDFGLYNIEFGTYVKQVTNSVDSSDEWGGNHYYHILNLPNNGHWTHVILNMHPDHRRGDSGSVDPGFIPYPTATNGPNGGDDPPATFNYFDALTRFYFSEDDPRGPVPGSSTT